MLELSQQIIFDEAEATQVEINEFGAKYNQLIEINGANGNKISVNFVWIKNNDGIVRLVTAIPTKK